MQAELLYHVQCDLYNLDTLNPEEFVEQLLPLPTMGVEERILQLIRQAMHQFPLERAILKYIRIIDKLLRVPAFAVPLQHCLADIYTECLGFIAHQKSTADLEELKLMRKYWVGRVHPMLLWQIKQKAMASVGIDVDAGIRVERVKQLREYYARLGLSGEEIRYHLDGNVGRGEPSPGRQQQPARPGMAVGGAHPHHSYHPGPIQDYQQGYVHQPHYEFQQQYQPQQYPQQYQTQQQQLFQQYGQGSKSQWDPREAMAHQPHHEQ